MAGFSKKELLPSRKKLKRGVLIGFDNNAHVICGYNFSSIEGLAFDENGE